MCIKIVIVTCGYRKRCSNKQGLQCHETELAGNDYATTDGLLELVEYEGIINVNTFQSCVRC